MLTWAMTIHFRRCLIVVGVLVTSVACGSQRKTPPEKTAASAAPAPSVGERPLLALLPATFSGGGWSRTKAPQAFGSENLWEVIDGAAETYLGFGFQEAATAGYVDASGIEANVEIYRMSDGLGAFGIYAQEADPRAEFLPVGNEAAASSNALVFYRGAHYVKIAAFKGGEGVKGRLRQLAEDIARGLPAGERPAAIDRFPPGRLVAHSVRYVPKDALGQGYLGNGLEAQYQDGAKTFKLTVVTLESAEAARDALQRYRGFIATGGKVRQEVASPGEGGFSGDDKYYGRMLAIRSGQTLAVALGASSDGAAASLINEFLVRAGGRR
jgi:hypothetical protein